MTNYLSNQLTVYQMTHFEGIDAADYGISWGDALPTNGRYIPLRKDSANVYMLSELTRKN